MKQNQNTNILRELRVLARFCSFRRTKIVIFAGLLFHFFYSLLNQYRLNAVYLIFLLFFVPPVLTALFGSLGRHSTDTGLSPDSVLTCLLTHYHFRENRFYGESFSFVIQIFAMMLWQKQNTTHPIGIAWYDNYPLFFMIGTFVIMILIYFFYRLYLPHKLLRHDYE